MQKSFLIICLFMIPVLSMAQKPNWQNLDLQNDSVFGISTEKAYAEIIVHKKKHRQVIVGVIDSGVDTSHEDLKEVIWSNPKENYNGKDNDRDGYIGDVHGWDFIGGPRGDVELEQLELVRMVRKGKGTPDMVSEYDASVKRNQDFIDFYNWYAQALDSMTARMGKDNPTRVDFLNYEPQNDHEKIASVRVIHYLHDQPDYKSFRKEVDREVKYFEHERETTLSLTYNPRLIVGDDTANAEEHFYGNPDVMGPGALHGTHVSGIIAAVRNNGVGIQGIADHTTILMIRTVPNGDERDKDVANAIRYAADHGCKVVNMSFGKPYSPDKKVVDEAVRYAMSKDVLIIHAAGNDGVNLDLENSFPTKVYDSLGIAGAWIEVGASGWRNDSTLVARFSNYGKYMVDVFAPGVNIYSTIPGSKYTDESGTSMAAPVVAGMAALIREYYPKLSALQVKEIIMNSVVKPTQTIRVHDKDKLRSVPFSEICVSGGIVNVYNALLLAEKFH